MTPALIIPACYAAGVILVAACQPYPWSPTMPDLFGEDAPPSPPAAPPGRDQPRAATLAPPEPLTRSTGRPGERQVRLPDGRWVSSWSEPWRELCEVRFVLSLPPTARAEFMAGVAKFRGEAGHTALSRAVSAEFVRLDTLAAELLALPTKADRKAALDGIEAAMGPVERKAVEDAVWNRWNARRAS